MVILLSDIPEEVEPGSLMELVNQYYPISRIEPCGPECKGRPQEWKIELGDADREVANFITEKINGSYLQGHQVNAYCPVFQ
ncbi:MAG TPA: hypothetical protein EYP34_01115 [Chromatiaceae bacterium]|nr:hypothetical protein [Chromatiaceae bacterium]